MFGASRFREYALGFRVEGLGLEGKGSQVCLEIDRVRDVLLKIDRVSTLLLKSVIDVSSIKLGRQTSQRLLPENVLPYTLNF